LIPNQSSSSVEVYSKVSNFFELEYRTGKTYAILVEPGTRVSDDHTVFVEGKLYSSRPKGNSVLVSSPPIEVTKSMISKHFGAKLQSSGYLSKKKRIGDYHAYSREDEVQHQQTDIFRLYTGFEYRFAIIQGHILLVVNPHLIFEMAASISKLISLGCPIDTLRDFSVSYRSGSGVDGYLVETVVQSDGEKNELCNITDFRDGTEQFIKAKTVFPEGRPDVLQYILKLLNRNFDVTDLQRRFSFLDSKTSSKDRYSQTLSIVEQLRSRVFPLNFDDFQVQLSGGPVQVRL